MKNLVIDVSRWDEGIDLVAWKERHGLWGVIVKCGGNEGGRYKDGQFESHYADARAAGLHVGAYYYSTVTSASEAESDARHCLGLLSGKSFDMPIYIDLEDAGQAGIGRRALTDVALAFIRTIEGAGHLGGVYMMGSWWLNNVHADELRPYANWIAWWTSNKPSAISDVGMWQFGSMRYSDGDVQHDDVSGYTDANWCYVDYPSKKGGDMSRKLLDYPEMAAEVMDHFVDHDDAHGYSQISRDGDGTVETITLSDGTEVSFSGGNRDCSRLIQTCYVVIGVLPRGMHMWTGNERGILLENGFVEVSLDELERGDVLWVEGHTEMYMGDGIQAGARRSEYGTIDGEAGDQDGEEIARSEFDRWQWTSAYRCMKHREPAPERHVVPDGGMGAVYRMYNPWTGWHMWTIGRDEAQSMSDNGWADEGVAWHAPVAGKKVRRLYNPHNGLHHLTEGDTEAMELIDAGWRYEGPAWLSGGSKDVYRLYNPHTDEHFFTTSAEERDGMTRDGWIAEGVAFHAEG